MIHKMSFSCNFHYLVFSYIHFVLGYVLYSRMRKHVYGFSSLQCCSPAANDDTNTQPVKIELHVLVTYRLMGSHFKTKTTAE